MASDDSSGYTESAYLRVAAVSIGGYEIICTLPAVFRFYRFQWSRRSFSQQFILFLLIRYLSIATMIIGTYGFFGKFSAESCQKYLFAAPILKVLQSITSQLIMSSRTYTISRESRYVFWTMILTLAITIPLEFFTNIYLREPIQDEIMHNCTSGNEKSHRIAWINYAILILFDLLAICISTVYLWNYDSHATRVSNFVNKLLYEGLGYFSVLTAVNVFNLVLFLTEDDARQSGATTLGYVVVFIMSQRILLNRRENSEKYAESDEITLSVSRQLDNTFEINEALRSQFESFTSKSPSFGNVINTMPPYSQMQDGNLHTKPTSSLGVQVRVERTVTVRNNNTLMSMENYRKPRVRWDHSV